MGVNLSLDPEDLKPVIQAVVAEALARLEQTRETLPDRIAFSEQEAARLVGLEPHQLRDERLRGRIQASQVVGRRVRYLKSDLVAYLMVNRTGQERTGGS